MSFLGFLHNFTRGYIKSGERYVSNFYLKNETKFLSKFTLSRKNSRVRIVEWDKEKQTTLAKQSLFLHTIIY